MNGLKLKQNEIINIENMNKEIEIVVMSGVVVDVNNLPKNYVYTIKDLDEEEEKIRQHNKREWERIKKMRKYDTR
mgnify:CR=1 FL=1